MRGIFYLTGVWYTVIIFMYNLFMPLYLTRDTEMVSRFLLIIYANHIYLDTVRYIRVTFR
jgi:hypothetical protein